MSIEKRFDIPFVAGLALREKQIQQNYRPIIAVHKWFARRPGSLFRALALAEFSAAPIKEVYFTANDFTGKKIADPFMGGGTPLIEANRVGCNVTGFDINPMAAWIVREELEHLDISAYKTEAERMQSYLRDELEYYYQTDCPHYGDKNVPVKYFLWVKTIACEKCNVTIDLFPQYLVSENKRHPNNVLVCPACGDLNEVESRNAPGYCESCKTQMYVKGPAGRGKCICPNCSQENTYPRQEEGHLKHRLFAIEYYNPGRKAGHKGRFFKKPDKKDLARIADVEKRFHSLQPKFIPEQEILAGDETDRLRRWGYKFYREMFSTRQLLGLELSCRYIFDIKNERIRHALATNLSDLLRYQNLLCRYDTQALKSLDIFSVHGFPVGHVQCESNLLGIVNGKGQNVGSGGWSNIIDKYTKAKQYCDAPFEVQRRGSKNVRVPVHGEWIGERSPGDKSRSIDIHCADATTIPFAPESLDGVFTDPPYFGNVQYGELMDFCYVWLRQLVGKETEGFWRPSTRTKEELTGNVTQSRGLEQFTEGLARVYRHMAYALKPGAPLAFTYHHNKLDAYFAVGVAVLDAGLTCTATFPCPAEMGGSIHIHGTKSSIVDTVFVCRKTGRMSRNWLFDNMQGLKKIVRQDLIQLQEAGRKATDGDTRCIIFGHITRMAIWNLRNDWDANLSTIKKITRFSEFVQTLGDPEKLLVDLKKDGDATSVDSLFEESETMNRTTNAASL